MSDDTLDRETEILADDISDEALEAATGMDQSGITFAPIWCPDSVGMQLALPPRANAAQSSASAWAIPDRHHPRPLHPMSCRTCRLTPPPLLTTPCVPP